MIMKMSSFLLINSLVAMICFTCQVGKWGVAEEVVPGIVIEYMDTTVHPGDDFFRFVNGGWLDIHEIPDDRSRWGSFDELRKSTSNRVYDVLEEAIKTGRYGKNTDQGKAALFYETAMDTVWLNQLGIEPLIPEIENIRSISNMEELIKYLINAASNRNRYFFSFYVSPDMNNSAINAAYLGTGSLGLPERDYYTNTDQHTLYIQGEYKKHLARMLGFLGIGQVEATKTAENIFGIEKQMASEQMKKEDRRNPLLRNNPRSIPELSELMPAINWNAYFDGIGATNMDTVIVADIGYFESLASLLKEQNLPEIKEYMMWVMLNQSSTFLTTEIDRANFDFYGKILSGTPAMLPRWERVLDQANRAMGEAIGKLYTDKYFPPQAKEVAQEMVDNILLAFGERLKRLDWMTDSTKKRALEKLAAFNVKIGYPDEWKNYEGLVIKGKEEGGSYLGNIVNISEWNWEEDLAKIGQPVDKDEWFMAPQIVNAYYSALYNEIVFPAAILQPPFYNYLADAAVNYGGIGAVIGHEISHGFDDQGSRFDADGNLNNWWTEIDRQRFEERSKLMIEQYSEYEPLEGVNLNGAYNLGENIGDLGGVNVAYDGLQLHLEQHGDPGLIDGFTQDQRFFISWGTIWRIKFRDEALRTYIATAPHSPGMYRAFGPLVNIDAFYDAFNISEHHELYKPEEERVVIW
jgi:putative endopeptidase